MMLACKTINKKYRKAVALKDVELELKQGKIYALLGPNGSGKTTLMKAIVGVTKLDSGQIIYKGKLIGVESKKEIAYMPTESYIYLYMTVKDAAQYYQDFFSDFDLVYFKQVIERLEIGWTDKLKSMSTGAKAKLKFALTIARQAKIIMLDEPLNGIDIIAKDEVLNIVLERASEDNCIVISSHLIGDLERLVDEVIFIKKGEVILASEAEQIREERGMSLEEVYKEIYKR